MFFNQTQGINSGTVRAFRDEELIRKRALGLRNALIIGGTSTAMNIDKHLERYGVYDIIEKSVRESAPAGMEEWDIGQKTMEAKDAVKTILTNLILENVVFTANIKNLKKHDNITFELYRIMSSQGYSSESLLSDAVSYFGDEQIAGEVVSSFYSSRQSLFLKSKTTAKAADHKGNAFILGMRNRLFEDIQNTYSLITSKNKKDAIRAIDKLKQEYGDEIVVCSVNAMYMALQAMTDSPQMKNIIDIEIGDIAKNFQKMMEPATKKLGMDINYESLDIKDLKKRLIDLTKKLNKLMLDTERAKNNQLSKTAQQTQTEKQQKPKKTSGKSAKLKAATAKRKQRQGKLDRGDAAPVTMITPLSGR